jgi:hypothetical protein
MFDEKVVTTLIPTTIRPTLFPQFNDTVISGQAFSVNEPITYQDHFYVAMSNLTDGTPLPPWIGSNFYFLPFSLSMMNQNLHASQQLQGYRSSTIGFGTEVNCTGIVARKGQRNEFRTRPKWNSCQPHHHASTSRWQNSSMHTRIRQPKH